MLEQLLIRNFALFEEITVVFQAGLSVLTGETGAGKSLVVDAMGFLCGGKADKDLIRLGSDRAYVEGTFLADGNQEANEVLQSLEMEADDGLLLISREMNRAGRNISRVNGLPVTLGVLRQLTEALVDIHGQHAHQSLLQENKHLKYLDSFGDAGHRSLLEKVKADYEGFRLIEKQYQEALASAQAREEQLDLLRLKDKELAAARLEPGEDETLAQSRDLLRHAGKIRDALDGAFRLLYEDESGGESAWVLTRQAQKMMEGIAALDPRFQGILERIRSAFYELEELGHDLHALSAEIESEPGRLEQVEERLDLLRRLERKYGAGVDEMLAAWQEIKEKIRQLETLEERLDGLSDALEKQKARYQSSAQALSASRISLARRFEKLVETHMKELNMSRSKFRVAVQPSFAHVSADGMDEVRMLIAPNLGEDFKPLAKIASGGELSRLMLALKAITAENNAVPTMVFDEIDTGISGITAQVIARKLWDTARFRQVICVSHLHQIAAMASSQLEVEKRESEGRTLTAIKALEGEERVRSLAVMLGGAGTRQESGRQHARALLEEAQRYRESHPLP